MDDIILEIEDVYSLQRLHMQPSCHNQGTLLASLRISSLFCDDNAYVRKCLVFTKTADLPKENRQRQASDTPF